jgi:hypothetical protein
MSMMSNIAIIVSTLGECGGTAIESHCYLGLGGDIHAWNSIKAFLVAKGLITVESHVVKLTAAGQDLADELNSVIG